MSPASCEDRGAWHVQRDTFSAVTMHGDWRPSSNTQAKPAVESSSMPAVTAKVPPTDMSTAIGVTSSRTKAMPSSMMQCMRARARRAVARHNGQQPTVQGQLCPASVHRKGGSHPICVVVFA